MSTRSCELEDEIDDIDKLIAEKEKEIDSLESCQIELDSAIEDLTEEKEALQGKLYEEEEKFEPSLSVEERQ